MDKLLWVMAGGARYLIQVLTVKWIAVASIWSTLFVNVVGSLLIGIAFCLFDKGSLSTSMRLFLMIGILGGFTTFSSFALDTFVLFKEGESLKAIIYILLSNVLSISAAIGGYYLFRYFTQS